ncbi:hypothetical protein ACIQUM_42835 [Amycolatopsis azurea]|uniref:hypothetical protein n=1 Tax=Amycolatopsis azurea TaxID=36819 RepID=UPI0038088659
MAAAIQTGAVPTSCKTSPLACAGAALSIVATSTAELVAAPVTSVAFPIFPPYLVVGDNLSIIMAK